MAINRQVSVKELIEDRSVEEWLSSIKFPFKNIGSWFEDVKIGNTTFSDLKYGGRADGVLGRSLTVNVNHVELVEKQFWFIKWNEVFLHTNDSISLYDTELSKIDTSNIDEAIRIALEQKQQRQDAIIYGDFNE